MNDTYKPTGVIKIYDEEGNLVQETHNMIVRTGRKKILGILTGSVTGPLSLNSFYECGSNVVTTASLEYSTISSYISENTIKPIVTSGDDATGTIDLDTITFKLSFSITAADDVYEAVTAIGTLLTESDDSYSLFSRANIDPLYIPFGRTYKVDYTMYF